MTNHAVNFDDENKKHGLHLPVINCRREELRLKFPLITLISYFSEDRARQECDSRKNFQITDIPFICVDDEVIIGLVQEMEKEEPAHSGNHYITLVDHNILDTFQKK